MATCQPTLSEPFFNQGQVITGIWNKNRYRIESMLGRGANGEVYRVVDRHGQPFALKVSLASGEIALEHKILKQLQEVARGVDLGPTVFDLDDVQHKSGNKVFFYVMEWVRGTNLKTFLQNRGLHWTPVLLLQLCTYLGHMHRLGHCFGDLKVDNCLVNETGGVLRLVDFGGVTPFDRGVKEYTEWSDRAWWSRGSRKAEESYDVFALSMIAVELLAPDLRGKVVVRGVPQFDLLKKAVLIDSRFNEWRRLLLAVWDGQIQTIQQFRQGLMPMLKSSIHLEKMKKGVRAVSPRKKLRVDWTDWLVLGSGAFLLLLFCQFLLLL